MRFDYTDLTVDEGVLFATDEARTDGDVHLLDLRVRDVVMVRRKGDVHFLTLSTGAEVALAPKGFDDEPSSLQEAYHRGMDAMLTLLRYDERERRGGAS